MNKTAAQIIEELLKHINPDNNNWNCISAIEHAKEFLIQQPAMNKTAEKILKRWLDNPTIQFLKVQDEIKNIVGAMEEYASQQPVPQHTVEQIKLKVSVIISATNTSGNEKLDAIMNLFTTLPQHTDELKVGDYTTIGILYKIDGDDYYVWDRTDGMSLCVTKEECVKCDYPFK